MLINAHIAPISVIQMVACDIVADDTAKNIDMNTGDLDTDDSSLYPPGTWEPWSPSFSATEPFLSPVRQALGQQL